MSKFASFQMSTTMKSLRDELTRVSYTAEEVNKYKRWNSMLIREAEQKGVRLCRLEAEAVEVAREICLFLRLLLYLDLLLFRFKRFVFHIPFDYMRSHVPFIIQTPRLYDKLGVQRTYRKSILHTFACIIMFHNNRIS